ERSSDLCRCRATAEREGVRTGGNHLDSPARHELLVLTELGLSKPDWDFPPGIERASATVSSHQEPLLIQIGEVTAQGGRRRSDLCGERRERNTRLFVQKRQDNPHALGALAGYGPGSGLVPI